MSTLILCLFIAAILPYLAKLPLVYAMQKAEGGYNNHHPREQQASLKGFGARALAAHQNSFESLIIFSSAILTALVTKSYSYTVQTLAIAYLISRVVYHFLYLMDWATLRSTVWFIGLVCSLSILWLSIPT